MRISLSSVQENVYTAMFSAISKEKEQIITSCLHVWTTKPFQNGVYCQTKEFSSLMPGVGNYGNIPLSHLGNIIMRIETRTHCHFVFHSVGVNTSSQPMTLSTLVILVH